MRRWLTCVGLLIVASVQPAAAELVVEKVVMVSRHGVRSPTTPDPPLSDIARRAWPSWPVPAGQLTPRGEALAKLMGAYYRKAYAARGLLPADGCPAPGAVFLRADIDQRTLVTGSALLAGMFPGCGLSVSHGPAHAADPLFHPVQAGVCKVDFERARAAVMQQADGDLETTIRPHRRALQALQAVLGCCAPRLCAASGAKRCSLATLPSTIALRKKDGGAHLTGPISIGSTASEIFLLEYAQGLPRNRVAWGRASSPAAIRPLLVFHRLQFDLIERAPYLAARHGSALVQQVRETLRRAVEPSGDGRSGAAATAKLVILVGHDTNIANIGGMLGLHWRLAGYLPDETPPAGALAFELLRDTATGRSFVRAKYYSQTLLQMRRRSVLDLANPPAEAEVAIPGCANTKHGKACAWSDFDARVDKVIDRDCVGEVLQ
jgi:4-phytase/acid phosphatase